MLIGVPKEIKTNENRIALVPAGAEDVVQDAGLLPVAVEPNRAFGHGRFVAVHDRDVVAASRKFEHEVQADVAIPAHDERSHGR